MNKPRVLLADDHTLVMEGIKSLLAGHVELVGSVGDGNELIAAAVRLKPDVIVLDISMPALNGIEAARQLRKSLPETKLIFLTMHGDSFYVNEALRLGAAGYLLKSSAPSELVEAIHTVLGGRKYVTRKVRDAAGQAPPVPGEHDPAAELTSRQREVLKLVAEGKSAKEIGFALRISVKTAEFHKSNLMRKLGLRTTADLTKYAVRRGITEG